MKLIVGLGNPGPEYAQTRHNAGFMAIERLAQRHGMGASGSTSGTTSGATSGGGSGGASGGVKHKFHAGVLEGRIADHKVLLMQPMTYMNRSGLSVGEAASFYKLDPADILVLVDEVALDRGTIRLRAEGSPGGHNGLADIQRALGTPAYPRLRIGVGPQGRAPRKDFVLARFTDSQLAEMQGVFDRCADAIESWLRDGIAKAMSLHNADTPGP